MNPGTKQRDLIVKNGIEEMEEAGGQVSRMNDSPH